MMMSFKTATAYLSVEFSISFTCKMFNNSGTPYVLVYVVTTNAEFTLEFVRGHLILNLVIAYKYSIRKYLLK